jgi:hypothetical protein
MIIAPTIEVHDVEFFRRLRDKNRGVRPPDPIGAALKAIAAPPASDHDRSVAVGKYVAGRGVPLSCETRRSAGGPPPPSTIPLTGRSEPTPQVDPADVRFLYSSVVSPDLRARLIHAVATRPRADQDATFYVAWEESIAPLSDAIAELVDREPAAMALLRLLYGPNGSPAKRAAAATETVADGLAKIVATSRERRAAEGARQVQVIEDAMRRNGLVVTRTPAVTIRKMFEVGDDGVERYPDNRAKRRRLSGAAEAHRPAPDDTGAGRADPSRAHGPVLRSRRRVGFSSSTPRRLLQAGCATPEPGASAAVLGSRAQVAALWPLMPQWRQDCPNNRPPTRANAISEMGQTTRPKW